MKKHILVVCQYFYPEQFRINDICKEWVKRGYKVTVVTGIPNYPQGKFYEGYSLTKRRKEHWNGIDIIRIPLIPRGQNSVGMVLNYFSFVVSGFFWKIFADIRADCVFMYETSPMTQALVGVWYSKRMKIPCYLYVTDLWPDNVEIITGIHSKLVIEPLNSMTNYIYKNCRKIFTSSRGFIKKINERGTPIEKLEFWPQYAEEFYVPFTIADKEKHSVITGIPDDGIFNIIFAGNIGYAQGLDILVEAGRKLKTENISVRFNIVGDGRYKEKLVSSVKEAGLQKYFNFIDKKKPEEIPQYMAACDAALICLSKSEIFSMTIPAKTQSCMSCRIPILVSADGEVRDIVEEALCGFTSGAEDIEGLVINIKKMIGLSPEQLKSMGERALKYSEEHFNKQKLLDKIEKCMVLED